MNQATWLQSRKIIVLEKLTYKNIMEEVTAHNYFGGKKMNANMVTAKYEAIFPFDILMEERVSEDLSYEWKGLGEAVLYTPELVDIKKLKEGHYGSRLRIDVTLDINKKPAEFKLDRFFAEKCIELLSSFLLEVWFHTEAPDIDPHLHPIFITCKYYDSTGSLFINPDTGQSGYEAPFPRGVVLNKDGWKAVATNLLASKRRDLAKVLLLNAKRMKYVNHPEIAVLLATIACEYKVRYVCDLLAKKKKVPEKLWNTVAQKLRPRFTEYQQIMMSLGIASVKSSSDPKIRALANTLEDLFGHRNMIAHRGSIQGYKGKQFTANEFFAIAEADIEVAKQFVSWLDLQVASVK